MASPISIGDTETIVLYGDSITEQNLYAAFVETFLISRLPRKKLNIWNFGWGGDTAPGGNARFARDVAGVKPTLLFSNFGMNDGTYAPPNKEVLERHLAGQRALAATVKAAGARHVFVTTCPCDYERREDKDVYNETLATLADGTLKLAAELGLASVDIFHSMREIQKAAKTREPGFTMIPDSIHPDPVGHLVMAWHIIGRLDAPKSIGFIEIGNGKLAGTSGVKIENFRADEEGMEFDLTLPHIPFYIPPEARKALELVPLRQAVNQFTLKVAEWTSDMACALKVDGVEAAVLNAEQLARGVDLCALDGAAWNQQGRALWELAQSRWRKHYDAWRTMGFESNVAVKSLPSFEKLLRAQREFVAEASAAMRQTAQPRTYRVRLALANELVLPSIEFSQTYPYKENEFDKAFPPENDPAGVVWKPVPLVNYVADLGQHFGKPADCVSYGRLILEADGPCRAHFLLGSDDGISVLVNGKRVLARDVRRGVRLGDDQVEAELKAGPNEVLFRVTQFGGGYGFALRAKILGKTRVRAR